MLSTQVSAPELTIKLNLEFIYVFQTVTCPTQLTPHPIPPKENQWCQIICTSHPTASNLWMLILKLIFSSSKKNN